MDSPGSQLSNDILWFKIYVIREASIQFHDLLFIISPPNIYMHSKCEVPGSKHVFTALVPGSK